MCLTIVSLSAINGISVGMTTGGHVSFGSDEGPSFNSKMKWKWSNKIRNIENMTISF